MTSDNEQGFDHGAEPDESELDDSDDDHTLVKTDLADLFKRIDELEVDNATLERRVSSLNEHVKRLETDIRIVANILSPLVAEANSSSYGWAHLATKEYVDKGLERLAGALRGEAADAVYLVRTLKKHITTTATVATELVWVWARERARVDAEELRKAAPSRIRSLVHAITGHAEKAGR
jgi:uncharacterized protein (UPF0335 family)